MSKQIIPDNSVDEVTGLPNRLLKAYEKNTGNKDIVSNPFHNPSAVGGTNESLKQDLQGDFDSYTSRGIQPMFDRDNEDIRAQKQDISDKWANGIVKAVGVAGTSAIESTAGLLYGLGSAITNKDINKLYDNDFSRSLDEFNNYVKEAMPNYYTKVEQEKSVLEGLGKANFWSDKFLNGLGYATGAMATGMGLAKFLSVSKLAGAGKLVGLSEEAIAADKGLTAIAKNVKFANNIDFAKNAVLMSTGESAVEARQSKDEVKQRLLNDILNQGRQPSEAELQEIEDLSDAAGNLNYGLNLIITGGSNALQFKKMLGPGFNASKLELNNVKKSLTKEGTEILGKDGLYTLESKAKSIGKERLKKFGEGFIEEGGQEGLQFASQYAVSDYYGRRFDKNNPQNDFLTSGIDGLINTLGSKEGWENILLGGLLGGPMGIHGVAKETNAINERTKKAVELINNSTSLSGIKNKVENSIQQASYQEAKDRALERGDIAEYKNLEFQERKSYIKQVIESGGFDLLMDKLESTKGMSVSEFKKAFGFSEDYKLNPGSTYGDTDNDVHKHIDEIKTKALDLKNTYDKIQIAFPITSNTPEDIAIHQRLAENLWNTATNITNLDEREKQLSEHITKLTNGAVNVIKPITDQKLLRKEFGDKYQEEFDKRIKEDIDNISNPLIKNEVIEAKKDIDKLAKQREEFIKAYNDLADPKTKEKIKSDIKAEVEKAIKSVKEHQDFIDKNIKDWKEGDFAEFNTPNGLIRGEVVLDKGKLSVHDTTNGTFYPLDGLLAYEFRGQTKINRISREQIELEKEKQIEDAQLEARRQVIIEAGIKLKNRINFINKQLEDKTDEVEFNSLEIQKLRKDLKSNSVNYVEVKKLIDKYNKRIKVLNKQIIDLKAEAKDLNEDIIRGRKALADLPFRTKIIVEEELKAKQNALDSMYIIIDDLRKLVNNLSKQLNLLKEIIANAHPSLRRDIRQANDTKGLAKKIDDLEQSIYANLDVKNKLQSDISKLERELQLMNVIADKYSTKQEVKKTYEKKTSLDGDEEITDTDEETRESIIQNQRTGLKKPDLSTTAGNDVKQHGSTGNLLSNIYDNDGNTVPNDNADQQRWFNYVRNPDNNFSSGEYVLEVSVATDDESKQYELSTGEPVIKAVLKKNGDYVIIDGKKVYTVLHLSDYVNNTQLAELKDNESETDLANRIQKEKDEYNEFRKQIIESKEPLYVKVTNKSQGLLNFAPLTQDKQRPSHNLIGRIANSVKDLTNKVFVSKTLGDKQPYITQDGKVINVNRAGKVYVMVTMANGKQLPVQATTRDLSTDELKLATKLVTDLLTSNQKVGKELKEILRDLVYYTPQANRGTNKDFYIKDGYVIFGETAYNTEDLKDADKIKQLQTWIALNKKHQVSGFKLSENERFIKVLDYKIEDSKVKKTKYETYDSYLDYLVGSRYYLKDKVTEEKTYKDRRVDKVIGTDLSKTPIIAAYAMFNRTLLKDEPKYTKPETKVEDNQENDNELPEYDGNFDEEKHDSDLKNRLLAAIGLAPEDKKETAKTESTKSNTEKRKTNLRIEGYIFHKIDNTYDLEYKNEGIIAERIQSLEEAIIIAEKAVSLTYIEKNEDGTWGSGLEYSFEGNTKQEVINKINAKYDTELATLKSTKSTEVKTPSTKEDFLNMLKEELDNAEPQSGPSNENSVNNSPEDMFARVNPNNLKLGEEYTRIDLFKEEKWFRDNFPTIQFMSHLDAIKIGKSGVEAQGLFSNALVQIWNQAEEGTVYHEAFHVVSQMFLSKEDRTRLYSEAYDKYSKPTVNQLKELQKYNKNLNNNELIDLYYEEQIAEDFRNWMLTNQKLKTSKEHKSLYMKIKEFIENFFDLVKRGFKPNIQEVFNRIEKGYYKDKPVLKKNLTSLGNTNFASRNLNEITLEEENSIMNDITYKVLNDLIVRGLNPGDILKSASKGELSLKNELLKIYQSLNSKIYKDEKTYYEYIGGKLGNFIKNNWNRVSQEHIQHLQKYWIKVTEPEENELADEIVESAREEYMKESFKYSTKDGLPPNVRMLIASLTNREFNSDSKAVMKLDEYGLASTVDFDKTYNWLLNTLTGLSNYDDMINRLKSYQNKQPFIKELLTKLDLPSKESDKIKLRTEFTQSMAKTKHTYITMLIDEETGNIYPTDSNANRIQNKIKQEWERNLTMSDNIEIKDNELILSKDKAEKILKLSDFEFLKALGIKFTNSNKISTDDVRFFESVKAIRDFVQKQASKDTVNITSLFKLKGKVNLKDNIIGRLNQLVELEAENTDSVIDLQFINSEGQTVYEITLNSTLSLLINDAKNGYPIAEDVYNKRSVFKDQLKNSNVKITIFDGIRNSKQGDQGTHFSEAKKPDLISARVNSLLNKNNPIFSFFTTADKKTQYGLSGFKLIDINHIINNEGNYEFDDELISQFYKYLLDEIDFINATKNVNTKEFTKNKNRFSVFNDIINPKLTDKLFKSGFIITDSISDEIREDISTYLDKQIKQNITFFKDNMLYTDKQNIGFSEDILDQYKESSKDDLVGYFTINDLISKIEFTKLFTGNINFYKDGAFDKRTPGTIATGKLCLIDDVLNDYIKRTTNSKNVNKEHNGTYGVLSLNDISKPSIYYKQYVKYLTKDIIKNTGVSEKVAETKAKTILKGYSDINEADAQGYITFEEYREMLLRAGEWTDNQEELYQKIISGEDMSKEKILTTFQVIKPMSFGKKVREDEVFVPGYLKLSLFPLIPGSIENTNLENLRQSLYKNKAGVAVYVSGNKVGAENSNNFYNQDGTFNTNMDKPTIYDYKYTKIQVDNKPKKTVDTKAVTGTQQRILIAQNQIGLLSNGTHGEVHSNVYDLDNQSVGFNYVYKQLKEAHEALVNKEANKIRETFLKENGEPDYKKIVKEVKKQLKNKTITKNVLDAIEYNPETDNLSTPFDLLVTKEKINNILNAIVQNRVINQKTTGDLKAQVAVTGFEKENIKVRTIEELEQEYGNDIDYSKLKTGRLQGLHLVEIDGKPTKVNAMQVLLPAWFGEKYQDLIKDQNGNLDVSKLPKEAREFIGYRIPTTGVNSIEYMEIAGFLPKYAGNCIVLASEISAKSGTDFDFDKMNLLLPAIDYENEFKTSLKYIKYDNSKSAIENSKSQIQNRIIDIYKSILSNPVNFTNLITPVSASILKEDSEVIKELQGKNKDKYSPTREIEFQFQIETLFTFLGSKTGIAQMAGQITHHVQSQISNLYINDDTFDVYFKHNKYNNRPSLAGIFDVKGNYISDTLSAYANAYVDAATDPFVIEMNNNTFTADTSSLMVRLGADYKLVNRFLMQPIILDYVKTVNLNESKIIKANRDFYKTNNDRIKSTYDKYFSKLDDEQWANSNYLLSQENKELGKAERVKFKELTLSDLESPMTKSLENMSENDIKVQLQVLDNFLTYQQAGKKLREAMRASSDTTKGPGKNVNESQNILNLKNKVKQDAFIGNFEKLFTDTFLGEFQKNGPELALEIQKDLYITQTQIIKDLIYEFNTQVNREFNQDLKTLDKITNDVLTFIINTYGNLNSSREERKRLLVDQRTDEGIITSKSTARKVAEILANKTHPLHNLYIFKNKIFQVNIADKVNEPNTLKILNGVLDTTTSEYITNSLRELAIKDKQLALDIIKTTWFQSGLNNSPINFLKIIPNELYRELTINSVNEFKKILDINKDEILEDLYLHNANNDIIQPRLYFGKRIDNVSGIGDYIILSKIPRNLELQNKKYLQYFHRTSRESKYKRQQQMKFIGYAANYDSKPVYMWIDGKTSSFRNQNEFGSGTISPSNVSQRRSYKAISEEVGLIPDTTLRDTENEPITIETLWENYKDRLMAKKADITIAELQSIVDDNGIQWLYDYLKKCY